MILGIKFTEYAFDRNDWFVLAACLIFFAAVFLFPKRLSNQTTCLTVLFSITVAGVFDNSLGYEPFDFYDIMDGPLFTVMDFVAYLLYAPFGYFFVYWIRAWRIRGVAAVFYILLCSAGAVGFEWLCHRFGLFHYKYGYRIGYSFLIYLFAQSATVWFYRYIEAGEKSD